MKFKKIIGTSIATVFLATNVMQVNAAESTFKDVNENDWYYNSIKRLAEFNIIGGYEDNTYKPNKNVTRAQAASIIAKALQLDMTNVNNPGFRDVPTSNSHYNAIAKLTELGVFSKSEKFNPDSPLTRAQMSKVLVNAFNLEASSIKKFKDIDKNHWSYQYAGTLGKLKITTNKSEFNPSDHVTRAQLAAFIERVIDYKRNDKTDDIWDTWEGWDAPVEEVVSPKDLEKKEKSIKDLKDKLNIAITTIEDNKKTLENETKTLEDAYEKAYKIIKDDTFEKEAEKELKDAQKNYDSALKNYQKAIDNAIGALNSSKKTNYSELDSLEQSTEDKIVQFRSDLREKSQNDFGLEKKVKEIREKLEDATDFVDDITSLNEMKRAYTSLENALEDAVEIEKVIKILNMDKLTSEQNKLNNALDKGEDVFKELKKELEDEITNDKDGGEKHYRPVLVDFEDELTDIKNALKKARSNQDGIAFDEEQKNAEEKIKEVESTIKKIKLGALEDEIEDIEYLIEDIEEIIDDEKSSRKILKDSLNHYTSNLKTSVKELNQAVKDGLKVEIEDAQDDLEDLIKQMEKKLKDSRERKIKDVEKEELKLEKAIEDAKKAVQESKSSK